MHFDDRMETVLGIDPTTDTGRSALWFQLVDLLSRDGAQLPELTLTRAYRILARLRPEVRLESRLSAARAVADRLVHAPTLSFLTHDDPSIVVTLVDRCRLQEDQWIALMPDIGPLARSRLRARPDLTVKVRAALAAFGSADFALGQSPEAAVAAHEAAIANTDAAAKAEPRDIAELVRRIEAFRHRGTAEAGAGAQHVGPSIAFVADVDGTVRHVDGERRALMIGLSLASPARPGETGVDAGVARAFSKRANVTDGRLMLVHPDGGVAHYHVEAEPQFERTSGRFRGYEGCFTAARGTFEAAADSYAQHDTDAAKDETTGQPVAHPLADAVRQMVHELRSPLNAIQGFAQLIDGQYFGPVSHRYRGLAQSIIADARHLATTFEDMDIAARMDTGTMPATDGKANIAAALVTALADEDSTPITARIAGLDAEILVAIPERETDRIVGRVVSALQGQLADGEMLRGRLQALPERNVASLLLELPGHLADGVTHRALMGEMADLPKAEGGLGFAFSLQLAARLAQLYHGEIYEAAGQLILNLPMVESGHRRFEVAG